MVSCGRTNHSHQHRATDISMVCRGRVAWTIDIANAPEATDINMAPNSSMDHGGFSRRPNPENQQFNLRCPILSQSQCSQASRQHVGDSAYMSPRLLCTTLLALLGNDMLPCLPQPSPIPVTIFVL